MFQKFLHSKALLFPDLRNFRLVSAILFWVHIVLKSFKNTYKSTFILRLYTFKEVRPKWKHRKRYKEEKPRHFVFWKISFPVLFTLGLGLITSYSLGVLIWSFLQTFRIVCIELWLTFKLEMPSTIFAMIFLFIIATTERKVCFCVKLFYHFLTEYSSDWTETCRVSFQILLGVFHKISTRISFWKMFLKLLSLQGSSLSRFTTFFRSFCIFILSSYCAEKFWHLHKYFHMSFVSWQGGTFKMKTQKKDIRGEKPERSVFEKTSFPVLFVIGLIVITPYSLGVLIWIFYQTFLIVCIELWLRF